MPGLGDANFLLCDAKKVLNASQNIVRAEPTLVRPRLIDEHDASDVRRRARDARRSRGSPRDAR